MPKQKFYDVKTRKSFMTDKFEKVVKVTNGKAGKRKITMYKAKTPSGGFSYRIIKNEKA